MRGIQTKKKHVKGTLSVTEEAYNKKISSDTIIVNVLVAYAGYGH